ncbi:methyltransferase [Cytophagaceae bacterium YF14B1]|uniref:Methyltransferase n=1 Tax=Xanthocytophaga flava TaxID=3048013 RepID=A0AAE3QRH7_9BACT|nr:methyltransferase [Xanthocytophaga flavus]MDJ1482098.1 methyltransferase [Xanthocytophaga flavus]
MMDPSKIMQVGLGFWASKTLLAAIKLELFTHLGDHTYSVDKIKKSTGIKGHAALDFLDALCSLGFLEREGVGASAMYKNTPETGFFLDKNRPAYIGGFFEMANDREYRFWADLEEGLTTGLPQNEIKQTGLESFTAIYQHSVREFTEAMTSIQLGGFSAFVDKFDFSNYNSLLDLGGSGATLSALVAGKHPHMHCISYDMPAVEFLAKETVQNFNLEGQVTIQSGNFFTDELPKVDMITMGNILHSFDLEKKKLLIKKSYEALPVGGALCIIELIIDEERRHNTFALLMSLNMLIESDGGFNYTMSDFEVWAREAGFIKTEIFPLAGPTSAAIAYK